MKIRKVLSLLGVVLLFCGAGWAQAKYTYKTYDGISIAGLNNTGRMVGCCINGKQFVIGPYGKLPGPGYRYTPVIGPNGKAIQLDDITDKMELTGSVAWSPPFGSGFIRWNTGKFTVFNVPRSRGTFNVHMNKLGHRVGVFRGEDARYHGFVGLGAGKFKIVDYPGADATALCDINDLDQVVGQYLLRTANEDGNDVHSFVLDKGVMTDIIPIDLYDYIGDGNGGGIFVSGINNHGDIVSGYMNQCGFTNSSFVYHRQSNIWQKLTAAGDFECGLSGTWATGINDAGKVVGGFSIDDGAEGGGFLATPAGTEPNQLMSGLETEQNYGFVATPVAQE